jgi:Xaa-Pro aminopeptidase
VPSLALALAAVCVSIAHASDLSDDLAARRARVMERIGPGTVLVLWSAPVRNYSLDIDYEYRQDSNLYYLTGLTQEGTILVLAPDHSSSRAVLFLEKRDPAREHWNGRLLTHEEASARSGITTVLTTDQLEGFVESVLDRERPELALLLPRDDADDSSPPARFAQRMRDKFPDLKTTDALPTLTGLRMVKTPYERRLLARSVQISSEAHQAGMLATHPGAYEYEVKAAVEAAYRSRGAVSWSYPSIVGSGPNATILHYPEGERQMQTGDLLLVDAAANYQYMSGDITRTYPVTGVFTDAQKDIYAVVLKALEEGARSVRVGSSLAAIHTRTVEVIKQGLLALGLITDASGDQYKVWFTHGATHYIGIDVHDVGDRNRPLEPGMAFVIEPGIYVRQIALDALPRTAENLAFIERVQPAVTRYRDIGVRVEDSFLLDDSGLRCLSESLPRTTDDIEAFMRQRAR